jgi:hypothetical protein
MAAPHGEGIKGPHLTRSLACSRGGQGTHMPYLILRAITLTGNGLPCPAMFLAWPSSDSRMRARKSIRASKYDVHVGT